MDQLVQTSRQHATIQRAMRPQPSQFEGVGQRFGMTRRDLQQIGEGALYSMGIVGISPEFVAGYKQLADAASALLVLADQAEKGYT